MSNIDSLIQIYQAPVWDGNLISKQNRDKFVKAGLVVQCEGFNIITKLGQDIVHALGIQATVVGQKAKDFTHDKILTAMSSYLSEPREVTQAIIGGIIPYVRVYY